LTVTETVTLYKIHTGIRNGSASWGESKIYESYKEFYAKLLEAAIQQETNDIRGRNSEERWPFSLWNKYILKKEEDSQVTKIYKAQKLVNSQWIDLEYTLTPPRLEIK
jgi:hypothetical protein